MPDLPDPFLLIGVIGIVGVLPFMVVMCTSFVKIIVVFSLIRQALGVQQIPPNMVLNGMALILTIFVMAPVGIAVFEEIQQIDPSVVDAAALANLLEAASQPFRSFLAYNTSETERDFFIELALKVWPPEVRDNANPDNYLILVPSFMLSELNAAFKIGFLLYLPFIAIDLIISNILLAMGMMMVSPMTISLPFKLLLFVFLSGWTQIIQGLILTYQ